MRRTGVVLFAVTARKVKWEYERRELEKRIGKKIEHRETDANNMELLNH